mgnify:CR=1 FL=1
MVYHERSRFVGRSPWGQCMGKYGRDDAELINVTGSLYGFAPIPFVLHQERPADLQSWHDSLIQDACEAYTADVLDVPDERHIDDMGDPPEPTPDAWCEDQIPPVGVWHRVPTNGFLGLDTPAVSRLRALIESHYQHALEHLGCIEPGAHISESWIQFYSDTDHKVLHNHERYGPPHPPDRWAGAYYIDDGAPDPHMPYAGVLCFRVRGRRHFFRPRPGLLLIWPADVLHEVHPFYGQRERVVVNFNINTAPIQWSAPPKRR